LAPTVSARAPASLFRRAFPSPQPPELGDSLSLSTTSYLFHN